VLAISYCHCNISGDYFLELVVINQVWVRDYSLYPEALGRHNPPASPCRLAWRTGNIFIIREIKSRKRSLQE
jgi:hypothetical protein